MVGVEEPARIGCICNHRPLDLQEKWNNFERADGGVGEGGRCQACRNLNPWRLGPRPPRQAKPAIPAPPPGWEAVLCRLLASRGGGGRRCHGTSPAAAGEGQAARSGDASERGASSAGPSAAAARGWPLTEAPPPLSHLYLLAGGGARPLPSRWPVAGGRPEVARCPGLGHPVRGGAAARGSTATGRRQREEPTDDGEDGRDPGEKQEDAVGEVGEVVVASAKLKQSVAAAVEDDDSVGEGQRWGPLRRRGRWGHASPAQGHCREPAVPGRCIRGPPRVGEAA